MVWNNSRPLPEMVAGFFRHMVFGRAKYYYNSIAFSINRRTAAEVSR